MNPHLGSDLVDAVGRVRLAAHAVFAVRPNAGLLARPGWRRSRWSMLLVLFMTCSNIACSLYDKDVAPGDTIEEDITQEFCLREGEPGYDVNGQQVSFLQPTESLKALILADARWNAAPSLAIEHSSIELTPSAMKVDGFRDEIDGFKLITRIRLHVKEDAIPGSATAQLELPGLDDLHIQRGIVPANRWSGKVGVTLAIHESKGAARWASVGHTIVEVIVTIIGLILLSLYVRWRTR